MLLLFCAQKKNSFVFLSEGVYFANFSLLFIGQQERDFFSHPVLKISHWPGGYTDGNNGQHDTMPPSLSKTTEPAI
jgi:hypothetical protein